MNHKAIRNLRIENFQSHELTEMAFDDGLNVIVGPSDTGKSAVIRALRWLLFNEPRGADFMRVGASQVRVTIEVADGHRVTRERTPSKNRYIVVKPDGEEQIYEGFGNTVPKEVSDATGVAKVMLDEDNETILHLGSQLEPPFLLAETGSIKAKAIGRLNGVHIIDAASRDTQRDLTRFTSEEKGIREQIDEAEEELKPYDHLVLWETELFEAEQKFAHLKELIARKERLEALQKRQLMVAGELTATEHVMQQTESLERAGLLIERGVALQSQAVRLRQAKSRWEQVQAGLAQTDAILHKTEGLDVAGERLQASETKFAVWRRLTRLAEARDQVLQGKQRVDAVLARTGQIDRASVLVLEIEGAHRRYQSLLSLRSKQQDVNAMLGKVDHALAATSGVPAGLDKLDLLMHKRDVVHKLRDLQSKRQTVEGQLQSLHGMLTALAQTEHVDGLLRRLERVTERTKRLRQMQTDLQDVTERVAKGEAFLRDNEQQLRQMIEEYSRELRQSGTCPVCFTPIDEHTTERLVEEFRGGLER